MVKQREKLSSDEFLCVWTPDFSERFGNLRHGLSLSAQGSLGNLSVKLKADPWAGKVLKSVIVG